tara:strand:+ start:3038 stop:4387 length:1350 start_codon:yes stop_codon:yes gene_type:complete
LIAKAFRNFIARRTFAYKLRNKTMNMFSNYENFKLIREKAELSRIKENRKHEVIYFHKVDDPYSHLTVQFLDKLANEYSIKLTPVLVGDENPETVHEPTLYNKYCLEDVKRISPYYGIEFNGTSYPEKSMISLANNILASESVDDFFSLAKSVSSLFWDNDREKLLSLSKKYQSSPERVAQILKYGNEKRDNSGYYFGSAFYYEKELYWGVDRLNHLEDRLKELGVKKIPSNESIAPLMLSAPEILNSEKKLNLTYYPSLNSPYTFVSAKRIKNLTDQYPLNLITKPVLPMLMRMMTIPTFKAKYIISDAAREGRKFGYEMKSIFSPIGRPARKAYSLFPEIDKQKKGFEYIDALLKASFQDGINIGDESFLKNLVSELGLDWEKIKKHLNTSKWKKILNENCEDMYRGNCWGVPSFKVTDADGSNPYYVWGQDRIWLVKEEIFKRLSG